MKPTIALLALLVAAPALSQTSQRHSFLRDGEHRPIFGSGLRPIVTAEMGIPPGTPFFDTSSFSFYYWDGSQWASAGLPRLPAGNLLVYTDHSRAAGPALLASPFDYGAGRKNPALYAYGTVTPTNAGSIASANISPILIDLLFDGDFTSSDTTYAYGIGVEALTRCKMVGKPCYGYGMMATTLIDASSDPAEVYSFHAMTSNENVAGTATAYGSYGIWITTTGAENHVGQDFGLYVGGAPASGAGSNAEPFNVFKVYTHANVGRNVFTVPGACVNNSGDCKGKASIPGNADGGFAVEARGARGVLTGGSLGQWQVIDEGNKPTCAAGYRGAYWHEFGGVGVADTVEVCAKDAANNYAWTALY